MTTKTTSPFKNTEYFTESHYAKYSEILNIPISAFVNNVVGVMDVNDENHFTLLLFHYHPDYVKRLEEPRFGYSLNEIMAIKAIRGIIVDVDSDEIVCLTGPYTNSFIRSSVPDDYHFKFDSLMTDTFGVDQVSDCQYKEWIYGSLIRVFAHKGVSFMSTHKRISCENSHFANSRTFSNIFFSSQDIFSSPESILHGRKDEGIIHLFILQDKDLIVDSRKVYDESRVYYICSFNLLDPHGQLTNEMTETIQRLNAETERPIYFPRILTPAEANQLLSPSGVLDDRIQSQEDIETIVTRCDRETGLSFFNSGEKVFMSNAYGIFAIVPPSAVIRSNLMAGTANINLAFSACISRAQSAAAVPDKIIVPFGFTYEQLDSMRDALIAGEDIDFSQYENLKPSYQEIVLTNLLFFSPRSKINECFNAYTSFGDNILKTADYLWSIAYDLKNACLNDRLDEFTGILKGSVQMKRYIQYNFPACLFFKAAGKQRCIDDIIGSGPLPHWNTKAVERFRKNVSEGIKTKNKDFLKRNAVLCFVMNAPGDVMFAMFRLEEKITKGRIAAENRKKGKPSQVSEDM